MTHHEHLSFDDRTLAAIAELEALIRQRYPEATFDVGRGQDDPEAIHLYATVDVEDRSDLLDLVTDRQMDIQIDDGIPVFVIPLRTPERNRAIWEAMRLQQAATEVSLDEHPQQPDDTAAS